MKDRRSQDNTRNRDEKSRLGKTGQKRDKRSCVEGAGFTQPSRGGPRPPNNTGSHYTHIYIHIYIYREREREREKEREREREIDTYIYI